MDNKKYSKIAIELVNNMIKLYHTTPVKFKDNQKILIAKMSKWAENVK
jgi:hypothetical protein